MSDAMDRRVIPSTLDTVFEFDYTVQAEDMRGLYEKAKRDQWNASRDIAWATPEPSDGRVLADELVDTVAGTDAKFFQATQVMDEARHNEVLERYIQHRLGGLHYPMPENERVLFDAILTDSRWYIKTIALQLVAETFAVSMFRMMQECAVDPLLGEVCGRILQDESRHMGFGMLALPAIVKEASAREREEMEDFTCTAVEKVLTGFFPIDVYRDMGFSPAQIAEIQTYRRGVAARNDYAVFRKHFRREMHAAMVNNLARIGLLTERVRPRLAALGITLPAV